MQGKRDHAQEGVMLGSVVMQGMGVMLGRGGGHAGEGESCMGGG
jgi:hypothetical protein